MARAVGLFSGGLDSMLAVEVLRRQGIEVLTLTFETPFFSSERARISARYLGVPNMVMDITQEHLDVVLNPRFGYGRHMNPCMDCHALMFKKAGEVMDSEGYDFLFSGEVLGQRPFSQNREALRMVARASGREDDILRPLSALCLPVSGPERRGLVNRDCLLGLRGRSRKPQMKLARQWGVHRYPSPAGGCLLTDPIFSRRLRDLIENEDSWTIRDLKLLTLGRHIRVHPSKKIVVGRNQKENEGLLGLLQEDDICLKSSRYPGPIVVIPHGGDESVQRTAASVCLRYSDAPRGEASEVSLCRGTHCWSLTVPPASSHNTDQWII